MTNWLDLPQEVKQSIYQHVIETNSIIYVPRDRRKKVDQKYLRAQHFHDILLVSKTFITPDDFAFAILGTAKLTFYASNDVKRLVNEVSPVFKQSVRRIHFSRHLNTTNSWPTSDNFDGFSNIKETLSTNFPDLKEIYVSMPCYCAEIGHLFITQLNKAVSQSKQDEMFRRVLSSDDQKWRSVKDFHPQSNRLANVAASFIGNRASRSTGYAWTRPHAWLRRLILYAEEAGIEVVLEMKLCITSGPQHHLSNFWAHSYYSCWSNRNYNNYNRDVTEMHMDARMSSNDYVLKVRHDDVVYEYYQGLAREMIHAPAGQSTGWWQALLRDFRQTAPVSSNTF